MDNRKLPFITVIIPVRNEEKYIGNTLTQLVGQEYPIDMFEIIVVDGMSTDSTVNIVDAFIKEKNKYKIRLFENKKELSSAARNIAVKNGIGDYYLLIDGHVHIPTALLLLNYATIAIDNKALVLGRPQPLTPPLLTEFQSKVACARKNRFAHSQESYIYSSYEGWVSPLSVAVFYHRSIFEEIGYFDESFDAAEDLEFNYRIEKSGIKCFISPELTVNYYPRNSYLGLYRQTQRYGYGRALFLRKHPERFTIETIIPMFFIIGFSGLLFMGIFSAIFIKIFGLLCLTYYFLVSLSVTRLENHGCIKYKFGIPLVIFVIHAGMGTGMLKGKLMACYKIKT